MTNLIPSKDDLTRAFTAIQGVEIPKMPDAVLALDQELRSAEPDIKYVGNVLASDPALSGIALKTINSAQFGLSRHIDSISQAAVLLGLNTIHEVILITALKHALGDGTPFQNMMWKHALSCAQGAKSLSYAVEGVTAESAYLAGLFQNVGALVLSAKFDDYENWFMQAINMPYTCLAQEEERYGTNHAVISFLLATHWKLPELACTAINNTHNDHFIDLDDFDLKALIAIINLAETTATRMLVPGFSCSDETTLRLAHSYIELEIDTDALKEMDIEVVQKLNQGNIG